MPPQLVVLEVALVAQSFCFLEPLLWVKHLCFQLRVALAAVMVVEAAAGAEFIFTGLTSQLGTNMYLWQVLKV
jgi:hypothetical protein